MIYLDNAATTYPKPMAVRKAVAANFDEYFSNPGRGGYDASVKCAEVIFECRKKLGEMFHCPPDRVAFVGNCTAAMNICLKGILRPGDHVICSSLEHNAVARPLYTLKMQGVEVDTAQVVFGDPDATVTAFARLIRPNTKMIVCTHASNVTGTVLPIARIGALCRERGILFAVDAAQSAGMIGIDMVKMNIDYLCLATHKGLYAPMGTGALLCAGTCPNSLIEGGTGTNSISMEQPEELPERLESGTLNVSGILGISAGVDFVNGKGMEVIYKHEIDLLRKAYASLQSMGSVILYTAPPVLGLSAPVLSFNVSGKSSSETAGYLNKYGIAVRAGLHCAPSAHRSIGTIEFGTVRIAPSAYTSESDINLFLRAIERLNFVQKNARSY